MNDGFEMTQQDPITEKATLRQSDASLLREHEISIRFLSRGCVIRVGCKEIAFESNDRAMEALNEYVTNPYDKGREWRKVLD